MIYLIEDLNEDRFLRLWVRGEPKKILPVFSSKEKAEAFIAAEKQDKDVVGELHRKVKGYESSQAATSIGHLTTFGLVWSDPTYDKLRSHDDKSERLMGIDDYVADLRKQDG